MLSRKATLFVFFIACFFSHSRKALAVTCHDIIEYWRQNPLSFNPLTPIPDMSFDVVNAQDCYWRFQNQWYPRNRPPVGGLQDYVNRIRSARITTARWTHTEGDVVATMTDSNNAGNGNVQLWLVDALSAFLYIGVLQDNDGTPGEYALYSAWTEISIILPQGVSKLTKVTPPYWASYGDNGDNTDNIRGALDRGIIGINGVLDPAQDYSYIALPEAIQQLRARYRSRLQVRPEMYPFPEASLARPWFLTEKADGTCVVIDISKMPTFLVNVDRQPNAAVCDWTNKPFDPPQKWQNSTRR